MSPRKGIVLVVQTLANIIGAILVMTHWTTSFPEIRFYEVIAIDGFIIDIVFLGLICVNKNPYEGICHIINVIFSVGNIIAVSLMIQYLDVEKAYMIGTEFYIHNIQSMFGVDAPILNKDTDKPVAFDYFMNKWATLAKSKDTRDNMFQIGAAVFFGYLAVATYILDSILIFYYRYNNPQRRQDEFRNDVMLH